MATSSNPADDHHTVVSATPARQGRLGRPVFWVLVISTLLVVIGFAAILAWQGSRLAAPGAQQTTTSAAVASTFRAPEPAPVVTSPATDHTAPQRP